jgi:hypothetical protein
MFSLFFQEFIALGLCRLFDQGYEQNMCHKADVLFSVDVHIFLSRKRKGSTGICKSAAGNSRQSA